MSESVTLRDPAAIQRLNDEIDKITSRPLGERMALQMLRRSNELAAGAVAMGRNAGWPQPSKQDWRNLKACKLIKRDERSGFLVLTSLGLMWQERIAKKMAYVAEAHFLCEPGTGERYEISVRCTCGWSVSIDKRHSHHLITDQWRAYSHHMDAVKKGVWRKPRSMDQVLDEVMAKRAALVPATGEERVDA